VVVDDHLMGITHVVRGEEWISSTPKHLLLFDWLGWERPRSPHAAAAQRRQEQDQQAQEPGARLTWFLEQGYLPEALLNFLGPARLLAARRAGGLLRSTRCRRLRLGRVNTVGPVFDLDKLGWLNGHYVRELSEEEFAAQRTAVPAARGAGGRSADGAGAGAGAGARARDADAGGRASRARRPGAVPVRVRGRLRGRTGCGGQGAGAAQVPVLTAAADALEAVQDWTPEGVQAAVDAVLLEGGLGLNRKKAYLPLRVALSGRLIAPPLDAAIALLGRERALRRLRAAAVQAGALGR
jgi:glutamyl-tRNA synthetase